MKKIPFFLYVLLSVILLSSACNDEGTGTGNSTQEDTTSKKDTIKSNPETFSEPH